MDAKWPRWGYSFHGVQREIGFLSHLGRESLPASSLQSCFFQKPHFFPSFPASPHWLWQGWAVLSFLGNPLGWRCLQVKGSGHHLLLPFLARGTVAMDTRVQGRVGSSIVSLATLRMGVPGREGGMAILRLVPGAVSLGSGVCLRSRESSMALIVKTV